ncbi:MAG: DUF308 domain-containing protein, partial [Methyloceanibacter sp.]
SSRMRSSSDRMVSPSTTIRAAAIAARVVIIGYARITINVALYLGVLAVIWPQISTIAVDVYVGWLFLLSGIVGLASMFLAKNVQAFLWMLLTAALSLFVGIVLLWHPVEGAASLTLVLIAFFIVEGVFQIVASLSYRDIFPGQWGWMLASGIVDLILAALIIKGWPSTATWALGLIVGINLITSGAAITMVALAGKALVQTVAKAAR